MLLVVGYILKEGIIPLAKMAELFFILLGAIFVIYNILIIPEIQIKNILPITYKDVPSIFKASYPIMSIFGYNILIFMFNDNIEHKGEFKKMSIITILILIMISFLVIIIPISVFGASVISDMPIPFLNTMMEISLFDVVERIESGIIMFWIITDFMLAAIFVYSAIHMLKVSFKMSNIKPLTSIYIIGIFFLSLIIAKSTSELQAFSENILTLTNIIMGFFLPLFIFLLGKVRKKV
jgi:spore germination protein KB